MDTKALRQKILDLAIRGKLVPQDPNDEPASVLLERIRAQKQQMVQEGKLKPKDIKNDSIIYIGEDNLPYEKFADGSVKCIADEVPFELPKGWAWARLKAIAAPKENSFVDGPFGSNLKTYHYTQNKEVRIIQLNNIGDFEWQNTGVKYTTFEHAETLNRCKSYPGDIVIAKMMPAGRAIIIPDKEKIYIISSDCVRLQVTKLIDSNYVMYMINSSSINQCILANVQGIGRTRTSLGKLKELLVPIPPYTEQRAIVEKIINIFSAIKKVKHEKDSLDDIVAHTRSKCLDRAVRGKLVPQNPNDEPASVLLERIRVEKEELIKQGKIKRDKKESVIFKGEDNSYYETILGVTKDITKEIPFSLPKGWEWCRLRDIASVRGGKRLPKGCSFSDAHTAHAYIRVSDMKDRTINTSALKYISDEVYTKIKAYTISSQDLYITIAGTIGLVGEVPEKLNGINLTENAVKVCNIMINRKFLCYALLSNFIQQQFQDKTHQVAMPKLALEQILSTILPIPPIKEQERISKHISTLLTSLDNIHSILE